MPKERTTVSVLHIKNKNYINFQNSPESKFWDKGNNVLYGLCKKYPEHKKLDEVATKLWLIGRSYSAALERRPRPDKKESNDELYKKAAKRLVYSEIDKKIKRISNKVKLTEKDIIVICDAHGYLVDILHELTGLYKISLASKYLHFHKPIVPIYDSRASKGIIDIFRGEAAHKNLPGKFSNIKNSKTINKKYLDFATKIYCLQKQISDVANQDCSVRDIDKYLLHI